jgi:hypothetical protein
MDVSRRFRIAVAGLCLAMLPLACFAQERRPADDRGGQSSSSKPKGGLVDFALKSINPADRDYGQCFDESRKILVDETVRNGYFWSNMVALGLLACLFIIIMHQQRVQTVREWTAAEVLVQYENSRASSIPASQVASTKSSDPGSALSRSTRGATATSAANQIGLFKPDVDLIMKVNSLEQQLGRSQDEAKLLRRQLNESDRRFQEEQQRNRTLKGA